MEEDMVTKVLNALLRIADALEESNQLAREDIDMLNGIDLEDIEFDGKPN